jgi:YVTN family beta-propeller protein
VSATISVGNGPVGVAFTPDGSKAYVTNQFDHTVSVIATATNTVVATVGVGTSPIAFGIFIRPRSAGTLGSPN